jgi:hypothetical protein
MTKNNIFAYTVSELKKVLEELEKQGKGDRLVLIPDDTDFPGDYRTIREIDCVNDLSNTCVYLDYHSDEDELQFWNE